MACRGYKADTNFRFVARIGVRIELIAEGGNSDGDQDIVEAMIENVMKMATKSKESFMMRFPKLYQSTITRLLTLRPHVL